MSSYVQLIPVEIGQIKAHIQNGLGATQIACIIKNTEGKHPSPLSPTQPAGGHPAAAARVAHGVLQAPRSATFWVNKKGKKALRRPSRNKKERARCLASDGWAHETVGCVAPKSAGARPRKPRSKSAAA